MSRESRKSGARRPLIVAGVVGTAALALSMSGTLSAFTASITNSVNTAGMGSLVMTESGPDATGAQVSCTSTDATAICATINKYGGSQTMTTSGADSTKTTTITIANTGSVDAASFNLVAGACTLTNPNGGTGSLCDGAKVTIIQDGTPVVSGVAPSALSTYTLAPVAAGASSSIAITFDTTGADNSMQGQSVSQPLTWTFNA